MDAHSLPFLSKYPRPQHLSNMGCCYEDEELEAILAKADAELEWRDYCSLFTISRCTGTYQELCYFLPWAMRYILGGAPDSHESITSVIHFVSEEADHLTADGLLDACQTALRKRFEDWTAAFVVSHTDDCRNRYGWCLDYSDHVENADFVSGLVDDLVSRPTLATWGEILVGSLADAQESPVQSAWFLEFVRVTVDEYAFFDSGQWVEAQKSFFGATLEEKLKEYVAKASKWAASAQGITAEESAASLSEMVKPLFGPSHLAPTRSSAKLQALMNNKCLQQLHLDRVKRSQLGRETPPTYWADLSQFLGLRW